ncbi:MAG: 4Fe-4S binding protein [Candidatus Aminicenantales bacterium]
MRRKRSRKYRLIQALRILSQVVFFGLFFWLLLNTRFPGEDYIGRVEIFFHFDPLLAVATFVAARAVFIAFLPAALTLIVTLFLGRVACGWVCPLGGLHQFFSFLFKKTKLLRPRNHTDNHTAWKYYILAFLLIGAVFTLDLAGLIDPFSLLYRSFITGVLPAASYGFSVLIGLLYRFNLESLGDAMVLFSQNLEINTTFLQGFFIGALFLGTVLLNMSRERFWCRILCPLGAGLGLASRWNLMKLRIDEKACIECGLCSLHCQTQARPYPNEEWKSSECVYCFTCSAICPTDAIRFPARLSPERVASVDLSRRRMVFTSLFGFLIVPFFRITPAQKRASEKLIRPPGALPEEEFLRKCVRCGECMKVCPTNALQPAMAEAGPEGLWTPMLVPEIGYCEYYCSLCTQVCPSGAIKALTIEQKNQLKIGTAWIDRNRCIPWKFGDPCIVCEEHCPVSPKAIKFMKIKVERQDGVVKTPLAPVIDTEPCTGCGICENKCPVVDAPAIYVTSVGETRSETNRMRLELLEQEKPEIE